jgi:hypothetical protein
LTIPSPDLENLGRLVDALTPWLDQVVIIGGWRIAYIVSIRWRSSLIILH